MRSRLLETALTAFLEEASVHLGDATAAGAEVEFEVVAQPSRLHRTPLYCYRPLTGQFIAERQDTLSRLSSHGAAVQALASLEGLDRYLLSRGAARVPDDLRERALYALRALLDDVFEDQSEFALRPERVAGALRRLEEAAVAGGNGVTVLATLSGLAMSSPELPLAGGLMLAQPDALRGVPAEALVPETDGVAGHLLVTFTAGDGEPGVVVAQGLEVMRELLSALRLFGDGRMTLGRLAWTRVDTGNWRPLALGGGGRPRGMLVIAPEQEDELRAFCSLVSRRMPHGNEIAWALERYEMGCDRPTDGQALSDYLLALRGLLEPEGPASGMLPGRLAALCALPDRRAPLAARVAQAVALEHAIISGASEQPGDDALVRAIADHLRALLRDVICGHLDPDLPAVADNLIATEQAEAEAQRAARERELAEHEAALAARRPVQDISEDETYEGDPGDLPWDEVGEDPYLDPSHPQDALESDPRDDVPSDEDETAEGPLPRPVRRRARRTRLGPAPATPYQDMLPF